VALLVLASGCGDVVDPQVQAAREKLLLQSAPTGETSVSKILTLLTPLETEQGETNEGETATDADGQEVSEQVDVVIKGRIYAGDASPWADGMAAFVLTDATGHEGESDHDPHTCPFCSRKINDYLAKISFLNDAGELIEIDSRKLFDVKDKQLVFVKGTGRIDDDGLLNVTADGLYLSQ